jgi:eukaryotic-like serine/threonine-protein kinase
MPHPVPEPALVGRALGGCRLIRRLGRGSMGEVYLGEQVRLGKRLVAVKIVPPDDSALQSLSDTAARTIRERFLC